MGTQSWPQTSTLDPGLWTVHARPCSPLWWALDFSLRPAVAAEPFLSSSKSPHCYLALESLTINYLTLESHLGILKPTKTPHSDRALLLCGTGMRGTGALHFASQALRCHTPCLPARMLMLTTFISCSRSGILSLAQPAPAGPSLVPFGWILEGTHGWRQGGSLPLCKEGRTEAGHPKMYT